MATARVSRPDWLRNAAGLRYVNYWRGTLQPRPTVNWCGLHHDEDRLRRVDGCMFAWPARRSGKQVAIWIVSPNAAG